MDDAPLHAQRLIAAIAPLGSCLVAYSGGVDSAVVAKGAFLAVGARAIAVTGISASLASGELEAAEELAAAIGIAHESLATNELDRPEYQRNSPDRCFHCKTELYERLAALARERGIGSILNGANADDLADFRPGMQAANDFAVRSPLAECGLTKPQVRDLAHYWSLAAWDKPATPCLSSRIAYGLSVTPERLTRVDAAEQVLRALGLGTIRVRHHEHELARLEAPLESLARLCEPSVRGPLVARLRELGFRYVTLDLEGFRSGSFQQLVPAEDLVRFAPRGTAAS